MKDPGEFSGPAAGVREEIRRFAASEANDLAFVGAPEPAWGEPLVGFSRGDDPLYGRFKEEIGPFYWTPAEFFALAFPGVKAAPRDLTVISWVLPQTQKTRRENAREKTLPSERWARARKYGEGFNVKLRARVAAFLTEAGREGAAPMNSPLWKWERSDRYGLASSWSERHAAYVSGLGTFGLCDGLITSRGKAMRCGSVVARIAIPPTVRPYDAPRAYCLFHHDGSCGKCIRRCPAGAITEAGHDKEKCAAYLHGTASRSIPDRFGFQTDACGLCQTGVPCESRIPVPAGK